MISAGDGMTRSITMDRFGIFTVSDDPHEVIATALTVAAAPQNVPFIERELGPDGNGLGVETSGSIYRAWSRDDLFPPYDEDRSIDPETQELWVLFKEPRRRRGTGTPSARALMHGDELRELVAQALALRGRVVTPR